MSEMRTGALFISKISLPEPSFLRGDTHTRAPRLWGEVVSNVLIENTVIYTRQQMCASGDTEICIATAEWTKNVVAPQIGRPNPETPANHIEWVVRWYILLYSVDSFTLLTTLTLERLFLTCIWSRAMGN